MTAAAEMPAPEVQAAKIAEQRHCVTCGDPFTLTIGNRRFFLGRGLALPRRCILCRALHRLDDQARGITLRIGDRVGVEIDGTVFDARTIGHSQKPLRLVLVSADRSTAKG